MAGLEERVDDERQQQMQMQQYINQMLQPLVSSEEGIKDLAELSNQYRTGKGKKTKPEAPPSKKTVNNPPAKTQSDSAQPAFKSSYSDINYTPVKYGAAAAVVVGAMIPAILPALGLFGILGAIVHYVVRKLEKYDK